MKPRPTDCFVVYPDGRQEQVTGATWDKKAHGWHFDPPLTLSKGTRVVSRGQLASEQRHGIGKRRT